MVSKCLKVMQNFINESKSNVEAPSYFAHLTDNYITTIQLTSLYTAVRVC